MKFLRYILIIVLMSTSVAYAKEIVVGGKPFTEGYITLEILAQLLEYHGFTVVRKPGLGGTSVTYKALETGEIDLYVEYSGTVEQVILKSDRRLSYDELQSRMADKGLRFMDSFGFNNTYAIGVASQVARQYGLKTISDLSGQPLRAVFSREFLKRQDGWPSLNAKYDLGALQVTGSEHSLAHEAIRHGKADLTDVYSTDAKIKKFNLKVLEDNLNHFPIYKAAPLVREGLPTEVYAVLSKLTNQITEAEMTRLNDLAEHHDRSFSDIASTFLTEKGFTSAVSVSINNKSRIDWHQLLKLTGRHLYLTFVAILLAIAFSVPLGVFLYVTGFFARTVITIAGILQTIPSIALLVFMIPFFGIGVKPAIVALFLYSILPILRNTYSALHAVDPSLKDTARGIGLYRSESLRFVELPLSLSLIVAGIRTTAVINIGTATLAAFIGAGGLGEPIVTGLALNDTGIILQGAIPAALLAILVEVILEWVEKRLKAKYAY